MFEYQLYDEIRDSARAVADARTRTGLATGAQLADAVRAVQAAQDILDGVQADLLSRMRDIRAHEDEGSPTLPTWMRRELRIPVGQARSKIRAGHTLRALPDAADAMSRGQIRLAHVLELSAGIRKVGADIMADAQGTYMPVAKSADPAELRATINHLHSTLYPDDLEDSWAKGMDKRDFKVTRCGDGYHVSGFLDIVNGAKVHAYLKSASAGDGGGDTRQPSVRRVEALSHLIDAGVAAGEPDNGIRPQIQVTAELETLLGLPDAQPATLAGFGPIGRDLLGYLTCTSDLTGVLTDGVTAGETPQAKLLNVGRTARLATPRQRHAVIARQDGLCANPGCTNTQLEIHHVEYWERDLGKTDLANLIGLCSGCHHLTHQQRLTIEPDSHGGFTFRRAAGRAAGRKIDDHARQTRQRIRQLLRRALKNAYAEPTTQPPEPATPSPQAQTRAPGAPSPSRPSASSRRANRPTWHGHQHGPSIAYDHLAHLKQRHRPPLRT